jgi:hypothetical protein
MKMRLRSMIGTPDCQTTVWVADSTRVRYVRAVPEPFYGGLLDRIRDAWSVICGETFAIYWPKAGELEAALGDSIERPPRADRIAAVLANGETNV